MVEASQNQDKVNILIVDDKRENLLALETILKSPELHIIRAPSGNDALARLLEMDFACIVLDVKMPEMDGFELSKIIREDGRTKFIPIIFVSGHQRADTDIFKGYQTGAVDYLLKPLDPVIVRSKVGVFAELFRKEAALKRTEAMLAKYTRELEYANKELSTFSYSVSHDLLAPVRRIMGFNQILIEDFGAALGAEGMEWVGKITDSARKMLDLIDCLLTLSRITTKTIETQDVDLSARAKEIIEDLRVTDPQRKIEFVVAEGVVVNGDARLLSVVLQNLLANAWKFTSKSKDVKIEFGILKEGTSRTFFIRDNGDGFNMEYANNLFGAFQRLHDESDFPGTGIGLATVQRVIHRHGGRIWAEGAVKRGATFFFTLAGSEVSPSMATE